MRKISEIEISGTGGPASFKSEGNIKPLRFKNLIMPFGKHKGRCMTQVPVDYLVWLERSCKPSQTFLRDVVRILLVRQHRHYKTKFAGYKDLA